MCAADAVNDADRLAVVDRLSLIDTEREPVFEEFARVVARLLDAPYAFVTIVDDLRSFWKAAHGTNDETRSTSVEESFCQYVIRSRDALLIDDATTDPLTSDNPSIESMGLRAWAGAPIVIDGQVVGSFCVVDTTPRSWTASDRAILLAFRDQVQREFGHRQTLQNQQAAHRADTHSLAALREELIPAALPIVPGVELAARHWAATDGEDVLGDFYDAFDIDGHRWGVVLGDVCGHGAAAARQTALVRYTLRSALTHADDPADAFSELDTAVQRNSTDPGRYATLTYLEIDTTRPTLLRRVSAGHPPPLLRRPDGRLQWLTGVNSTPVGLAVGAPYVSEELTVESDSIILLYSDGATDARDSAGNPLGPQALRELVSTAPTDTASEFTDHIAQEILAYAGDNLLDDIALLSIKLRRASH